MLKKLNSRQPVSPAFGIPHYKEMVIARLTFLGRVQEAIEAGTNLDTFRWLRSRSIDPSHACNVAGLIVETDITTLPGRLFSFSEYGFPAAVIMVHDRNAETPVDLIAWTKDMPRRVYRHFGYADALGVDQLYNPTSYLNGTGLMIRRTPLDWLSAGCAGCVILDYDDFAQRLRTLDIPQCRLVGESVIHGREIRRAIAPLPDNVRIFVPASQTGSAS
jgi:hypothetical protein